MYFLALNGFERYFPIEEYVKLQLYFGNISRYRGGFNHVKFESIHNVLDASCISPILEVDKFPLPVLG